ncbi:MAG: hypothetical protein GXP63_00635 [DPANN group archaeon]|nr:hypothetical protein [DPANN group archaeon]
MADDKDVDVSYNVPLRKSFLRTPKYKRAKKAIAALKEFIRRHQKVEEVKIGKHANEKIWANGIKNPPHHIKVHAVKEDNIALVELEGKVYAKPKVKEEKKEGGLKGKIQDMVGGGKKKSPRKKEEAKPEEKKSEPVSEEKKTSGAAPAQTKDAAVAPVKPAPVEPKKEDVPAAEPSEKAAPVKPAPVEPKKEDVPAKPAVPAGKKPEAKPADKPSA